MSLLEFMTREIAMDLGTANTLIIYQGKIVVDNPSIVACDIKNKKMIAIGTDASLMEGRTHNNIKTIRPVKEGVISDFDASEKMISGFINNISALKRNFFSPAIRMVVCIPCGISKMGIIAIKESCLRLIAQEVFLIYEPLAAAIGIGLDVMKPHGNIIVDIGGGTTEIAVICLGGIVCSTSINIAGDVLTQDILNYMKTIHHLQIGFSSAEKLKIEIGLASEELENIPDKIMVRGKNIVSGNVSAVTVSHREISKALDPSLKMIEDSIMVILSMTPPELSADIYKTGLYLAGGGAMLRGLDKRISKRTGLQVYIGEDPLRAAVKGTYIVLKNKMRFNAVLIK